MARPTPIPATQRAVLGGASVTLHLASAPERDESGGGLIRKLDGLAPLTAKDRAALASLIGLVRPAGPRSVLVEQDVVADHALVVFAGFAGRYKRHPSGRRQIVALLSPGDLCDRGALHHEPLDHTVETLSHCQIAWVPRAAYRDLLDRHPAIERAMQRARLAEEATAREWIANLGLRSGLERTAHLLCELHERLRSVGQASEGQFDDPLTPMDMADALGMTSVHVSGVLQILQRDGLIALRGGRLRIVAPDRLRQLAGFEAAYLRPRPAVSMAEAPACSMGRRAAS